MRIVTLTTDFGLSDWFVGTVKGVILGIAPTTQIVDISHGVPSGNILAGAFALASACQFFPTGTIHVAVVDPGVGSARKPIAIQTKDCFFIGPDNGVLSLALENQEVANIWKIENDQFFRKPVSQTFHGRDIFAPVAAHLAAGIKPEALGSTLKDYQKIPRTCAKAIGNEIKGEVIYIDHFGNAITNLDAATWSVQPGKNSFKIEIPNHGFVPLITYYQQVKIGEAGAIVGSSGFLEIAVNGGRADKTLELQIGSPVIIRLSQNGPPASNHLT